MQVKTGVRAGVTPQQLTQNVGNAVGKAAQDVGAAAQNVGNSVQAWWRYSKAGDFLNKAFWFPLDPPS
jgi:hypothetical protein